MAAIQGTVVASRIVPTDTADTFATHDAQFGMDGHRSVDTLVERDGITEQRRREGMTVYVIETGREYRLVGGVANSDWQEDSNSYNDLEDLPNIPTKVSDLVNDSGFATVQELQDATGNVAGDLDSVMAELDGKLDKTPQGTDVQTTYSTHGQISFKDNVGAQRGALVWDGIGEDLFFMASKGGQMVVGIDNKNHKTIIRHHNGAHVADRIVTTNTGMDITGNINLVNGTITGGNLAKVGPDGKLLTSMQTMNTPTTNVRTGVPVVIFSGVYGSNNQGKLSANGWTYADAQGSVEPSFDIAAWIYAPGGYVYRPYSCTAGDMVTIKFVKNELSVKLKVGTTLGGSDILNKDIPALQTSISEDVLFGITGTVYIEINCVTSASNVLIYSFSLEHTFGNKIDLSKVGEISSKVPKVTSTDNAIVRFDGTTGAVQNSSVVIDDVGNVELTTADKGVIMKSANGTRYRLTVDDSGNLETEAL